MSIGKPGSRLLRPDIRRDVDEELASHVELRQRELVARGMAPAEARDAALRRFGNVAAIARECRDINERSLRAQRRTTMWVDLRQDIGFAFRLLARAPGFTAVAVFTLAIGVGATTAIFSLANWALLRSVPGIDRPEELRQIWVGTRSDPSSFSPGRLSYPNLLEIAPRMTTVDLAAQQSGALNVAAGRAPARTVMGKYVTASYFPVLGARFIAGRPFTTEEDHPAGAELVAVVSAPFARTLFGSPNGAVGQTLQINARHFVVVGVTEDAFGGIERMGLTVLWLPGASYPVVNHMPSLRYDNRGVGGYYALLGRLRHGATWAQVEGELGTMRDWLVSQYPEENAKFQKAAFHMMGPIGANPLGQERLETTVWLMLGASGLVLLIACSNVASLLLMRGLGRRSEVAVRKALGAAPVRLVRQHLTEGTVLWLLGGAAGLVLVRTLLGLVDGGVLLGLGGETGPVPLDWRVVTFAVALSLVVGLVFSLLPAVRAVSVQPSETLKQDSASTTSRHLRVGSALSAFQLATSLTLVVGALLLVASLRQLSRVELGFNPEGLYAFSVRPGTIGYSPAQATLYREEFARRLALIPGVERVATAVRAPFVESTMTTRLREQRSEPVVEPNAIEVISPGVFEALGVPLVRGRVFSAEDLAVNGGMSRPVVVVSELLARQLFGEADPIGRRIEYRTMGRTGKAYEVIGVVGDVRMNSLTDAVEPMVFEPAGLSGPVRPDTTFLIRTNGRVDIAAHAQTIGASLNNALPVGAVESMGEAVARTRAEWDVLARLMLALAIIAGALAAVGLYGVVSFGVASRRREFGIRLALGASPARVAALVFRRTGLITAVGLALGCAGAVSLVRFLESRLFGVAPFDPFVWSLAALLLVTVALIASWIPARRAVSTDVTGALRAL
jgi:predicted permease